MANLITRFAKDQSGATAIEYGLIAGLVSIVCIAALRGLGSSITGRFNNIGAALNAAN